MIMHVNYGKSCYLIKNKTLEVNATVLGGNVSAVFKRDEEDISPHFIEPWWNEAFDTQEPPLAPRGNFFCLPFGGHQPLPDGKLYPIHGEPWNTPWSFVKSEEDDERSTLFLRTELTLDEGSVEKKLEIREGHPVVYERNTVKGLKGRFPVAYHPTLQLPKKVNSCILSMSPFKLAWTATAPVETPEGSGYSIFRPNTQIESLHKLPTVIEGLTLDMTRPPIAHGYEDICITMSDDSLDFCYTAITVPEKNYIYFQLKNPRVFAATMFWNSNQGRYFSPWNGRVFGVIGVEDCTSFFHYGVTEAERNFLLDRGFKTFVEFDGSDKNFGIICGAVPVPEGFAGVADIVRTDDYQITIIGTDGTRLPVSCDVDWILR